VGSRGGKGVAYRQWMRAERGAPLHRCSWNPAEQGGVAVAVVARSRGARHALL
jgi:hypothetical protein